MSASKNDDPRVPTGWLLRWTLLGGLGGMVWLLAVLYFWVQPTNTPMVILSLMLGGLCIGGAQAIEIPSTLRHDRRDWVLYSGIGGVGGAAVLIGAWWYGFGDIIGGAFYGLLIGVAQWGVLRDELYPNGRRWIVASVLGYAYLGIIFELMLVIWRLVPVTWFFIAVVMLSGTFSLALVLGRTMIDLVERADPAHIAAGKAKTGRRN